MFRDEDEVMKEIRKHRAELAKACDYDFDRLHEHHKAFAKKLGIKGLTYDQVHARKQA